MSSGPQWDYNTAQARFISELQRTIATGRRTARVQVEENFRGMLRFVFATTPPMGGKNASLSAGRNTRVDYAKGKRQGQRAILKDLGRAFQTIPATFKQTARRPGGWDLIARRFGPRATEQALNKTPDALWGWYKSKRNAKRRIMGRPRMPAWSTSIAAIKRKLLDQQGMTAAGWMDGVRRFNVPGVPAWISRHAGKVGGSVEVVDTATELKYLVKNLTGHTDSSNIQQKLSVAFTQQANAMARRTADYLNRQRIR